MKLRRMTGIAWLLLPSVNPAVAFDLITPVTPYVVETAPAKGSGNNSSEPVRTINNGISVVKMDMSGKGAVLCSWSLFVLAAHAVGECGWKSTPADTSITQSIADIDAFIIRNSVTPVTQDQLDVRKAIDVAPGFATPRGRAEICEHSSQSIGGVLWSLHISDADQLTASTRETLSIPREPVMNPCL